MTRTRQTTATGLEALVANYIQWTRPERDEELSQFQDGTDERRDL